MKFSHKFSSNTKCFIILAVLAPFHNTVSLIYCSGFHDLFGIPFAHLTTTLNVKKNPLYPIQQEKCQPWFSLQTLLGP